MLDLVTGYTPGPWRAFNMVNENGQPMTPEELGEYVKNSILKTIAEDGGSPDRFLFITTAEDGGPDICHVGNGPRGPANACLIASAPDMVDEIIRLRGEVDRLTGENASCVEMMDAAVGDWTDAKAELMSLRETNDRLVKLVDNIKTWADARCPCENEKPNPCPLCGADAEKPNDICLAAENTIPGSILQEIRDVLSIASGQVKHAPPEPDWFWRDLDPDDSGDSPHDALWQTGEGVVSLLKSSYAGPSFYAAIVPVLDASSDDTEVIRADTEEACVAAVDERLKARAAIPQGGSNG